MKPLNASFVTSASSKESWPESTLPEIVVVGRSNVGKSSFINALTNRKKLAYVGSTPGKTQLLNFFDIDGRWMLVDVPGYGYAKLSKSQLMQLGKMMDEFFEGRSNISCIVSLVDGRHEPTQDDIDMIDYFRHAGIPVLVAATKMDKVPKTRRLHSLKKISQKLQLPLRSIYPVSSTERSGLDEIYQAMMKQIKQDEEMPQTNEPQTNEPQTNEPQTNEPNKTDKQSNSKTF